MDAVTALSGSGPAYFFLIMEALEAAGVRLGLDAADARLLTLQTAFGAAKMTLESQEDASVLRARVTSKGGTTEQALKVLEAGGLAKLARSGCGRRLRTLAGTRRAAGQVVMGSSYFTNPLEFLISTLIGLFITAVMLRFLLAMVRADFYNPLTQIWSSSPTRHSSHCGASFQALVASTSPRCC